MAAPIYDAQTFRQEQKFICRITRISLQLHLFLPKQHNVRRCHIKCSPSRRGHHYGQTWPEFSPFSNKAPRERNASAGDRRRALCKELSSQMLNWLFETSTIYYFNYLGLFHGRPHLWKPYSPRSVQVHSFRSGGNIWNAHKYLPGTD
jgi:hypothetical protein